MALVLAKPKPSKPSTAQPPAPTEAAGGHLLPTWPITMVFGCYPVLWVLGLGGFAGTVGAVPMLAILLQRRGLRIPRGFGLWLLFMLWMAVAASQLDSGGRLIGFAFRYMNYVAATVFLVYVYNCSRTRLPLSRMLGLVIMFWVWVVAGGYLGVLVPNGSISTPMASLLPGGVVNNEFVGELVRPRFAEVQQPWGAPRPFERPSAPFPYTNTWGSHFALLMPFVLLYMRTAATWWKRLLVVAVGVAALIPAFATLNRGMFLAMIAGIGYAALRFGGRGQVKWMAAVVIVILVGFAVAQAVGVGEVIQSRTEYSATNSTRGAIYQEAFDRTLESPVVGYGAPRPSKVLNLSVGTQGQVWNVMFSFGFPALALFLAWIWGLALRTRNAQGPLLWLHVVPVMASFMVFYYGLDGTQLILIFVAGALVLRELEAAEPRRSSGRGSPRTASVGGR
ncbi:O-antigen ligase family protein [Thermomonospora umbrina]|uniref:O-antigen ligase-related domain-containing protein n=1 Tax=Thermomonospora umbrina TaxID=111806 RepID=A0A3D9SX19_9ACTN|nr:O-antigen ligase family protein [Thermomonospora umbrina]REE96161.1 hypothetical protein DFJ69_1586 [Thermomonospora umbrina]